MTCVVPRCKNRSGGFSKYSNSDISFHRFPVDSELKRQWVRNLNRKKDWTPSNASRICSAHFEKWCYRTGFIRKFLHSHAVPTIFPGCPLVTQLRTKQDAPRPSTETLRTLKHDHDYTAFPDSDTPVLLPKKEPPETEEDPLLLKIQPCRFCREYNKECLDISDKPYVLDMKTTIAFNNMEIQIDFNDDLSDKVCRSCDSQLRGMMSFIDLVKKAQEDFKEINEDADKIRVETEIVAGDEDMENIEIKAEPESNDEPIEDFVIVEETPFVKKPVKRKFAHAVQKKKPKNDKSEHQYTWDVEDVVDIDNVNKTEHSARGTGVRSSELRISGVRSETLVLQSVSDETLRTVRGETNRSGYLSKKFK